MSTALMALQADWIGDVAQTMTTTASSPMTSSAVMYWHAEPNWYHYPWLYPVTVSSPARPIKLTFREMEQLRAAARKDQTLRRILEKFTPQIEVTVSFEEP